MRIDFLNTFNVKTKQKNYPKTDTTINFKASLPRDAANIFKKQIEMFPKDKAYRKTLAEAFGIKDEDEYLLRPIIGIEELTAALKSFTNKNFMPGARKSFKFTDDRDFSFVKTGTFRANMHCHSKYSKEKPLFSLKIEDTLNQASGVANINAKKMTANSPAPNTPFIIGILDHNTVEGNIEAIELIKENPFKYRNLRVVLGTEISTQAQNGLPDMHLLYYGLNPKEDIDIASMGFSDVVNGLSKAKFGAMSLAHGLRYIASSLKGSELEDFFNKLFTEFKKEGKDKALFNENYYQGYLENQMHQVEVMKKISDKFKLISTGGLDSHGNNIFTEEKALSNNDINELISL